MTNMDSSVFHKEENNESKIMDGGNRGSGHTVRSHDRTGQRHGRRGGYAGYCAVFRVLHDRG